MILANDNYNVATLTHQVTFETAVTIKEVKHTAQILSGEQTVLVVVFRGDVAKASTKTKVVAEFEEYGEAHKFLATLLQAAERGESIKPFTIKKMRRDREYLLDFPSVFEAKKYFSYTLQSGASWEGQKGCRKVNQNPTTAAALIRALDNAVHNTQGSCYDPDCYYLV